MKKKGRKKYVPSDKIIKCHEIFPNINDAYDLFLKQMGGSTSTGNTDPCGPNCSEPECRKQCSYFRLK